VLLLIDSRYADQWNSSECLKVANQLRIVILSEAKNLVLFVLSLVSYKAERICRDEILRFAQNDKVKVALFLRAWVVLIATV
jgi:hypothetical protein